MGKPILAQPNNSFNSTSEVAQYIIHKYQNDNDKILGIYYWVTSNFRYDASNTFAMNAGPDPTAKINVAFERRKGVCDNISAIFNDICLKSGISSVVISGYTKQNGMVDKAGHSWCAASINNHWYLFDPTWDLGRGSNFNYFMESPQHFIVSHMPFDPLWQLLTYPISHPQFSGNANYTMRTDFFSFPDSIIVFLGMDSLQKLQSAASRIERFGIYNERIKLNYDVIKMNIEIAHQEKETELYNSAVEDLNAVTNKLNRFIAYRNNRFLPLEPDRNLKEMIEGLNEGIVTALKKLDDIDKSEAKLVLDTQSERIRIERIAQKIEDQKTFLHKYLISDMAERSNLFYDKK